MEKFDYPTDLLEFNTRMSAMTDAEHAKVVKEASKEEVKRILEEGPPVLIQRFQSRLMEVVESSNAFGRGRFHLMANRWAEAEKEFERAVREGVQLGGSYNNLANLARMKGDIAKANEYQKLSIENGCYMARMNLANTYFALGELELVREQFEKIFEVGKEGLATLYHIALAFASNGEIIHAIFILEFLAEKDAIDAMERLCELYYTLNDEPNFQRMVAHLDRHGLSVSTAKASNDVN